MGIKNYIQSKQFTATAVVFLLILIVFNAVYGLEVLLPTNINWIMSERHDWGTHHLGWAFYRHEPWTFPLGEMDTVKYPVGTNIGFFDNAPGVAILLKIFSPLLPEDFQYLSFWLLFCFLMAGYYSIKIFMLYNARLVYIILGALLIACNPVLVYRGMHPALSAHFLIIASIYFYLKPAGSYNVRSINRAQIILLVCSALINPYLCFIISGFNIILPLKHYIYTKLITLKQAVLYPAISFASVIIVWIIIGMITFTGNSSLKVSGGYSLYGLNLNSLINSAGFSVFFPAMPRVTPHQYEGYMYFGLGMFLLTALSVLYLLLKGSNKVFNTKNKFIWPLAILCIAAAVFSISNKVTYNDEVLFEYWMPKFLLILGDIFRACARVFWVPYYCMILFFTLIFIKSKIANWVKIPVLAIVIALQGYDLQHLYIRQDYPKGDYDSPLTEAKWNALLPSFSAMITYPPFNNHLLNTMDYQDLSYLALKNDMPISVGYTGRDDYNANMKYTDSLTAMLRNGNYNTDELYITTLEHLKVFKTLIEGNKVSLGYLDGYYIVYDKSKSNKIKFNSEATMLYKGNSPTIQSSNTPFVSVQDINNPDDNSITVQFSQLITNNSSIIASGKVVTGNSSTIKNDSVFVTISDGVKVFMANTKQNAGVPNEGSIAFSSLIVTNGFAQDSLVLGVAVKKQSGEWLYKTAGKLSGLTRTTRTVKTDSLPAQKMQIGSIDEFTEQSNTLTISGWTAFEKADATNNKVEIVFAGSDQAYIFATSPTARLDVTQYFNNGYNYDNSGYQVVINKNDIPAGSYKVGLLLHNKSNGDKSLMMTDKTFIKQ